MSAGRRVLVRVEDLLGRRVVDRSGRPAGRIEEIRAERVGGEHEVTELLLGPGALRERLAVWLRGRKPVTVRWDQVGAWRADRVVLLCDLEDLSRRG